ncbi:alpha/beta-hydrolase [Pholiota conissans]|uniref:Carboxylic ester hydrolase n=1 Tax=Pholiota conissans TaxID=109636 RepID=A0A9P6D6T7_9AGAR|nr:alpha/beta-hydrolase [Pholiota conissans]
MRQISVSFLFAWAILGAKAATATTVANITGPIVHLNYGSFQGNTTGTLDKFLGMPFAAPPVGNLRFAPPQAPLSFTGIRQATTFGTPCFQQHLTTDNPPISHVSEDCLFINVIKPSNATGRKKLPVLMWIYGGGFEIGDTSFNPGDGVVTRSIALGEPVIYVSANYRASALGFLAGKEVKDAGIGNAGMRDQRFAMEWVQSHIESFGGDPSKVTIWGESAGAISVGLHFVVNNGNPNGLFHAAFMESGSPYHLRDITTFQTQFDQLVADTGCTSALNKITCLRGVPFTNLTAAINLSPDFFGFTSLSLAWQPSVDGEFFCLYAKVPFVSGDCDDEGTIFAMANLNITTNAEFLGYMKSNYFPNISDADLTALGEAYPDDVTQGSPFDTGMMNALTPEYKRLAAIQGDLAFQAPRRFFLKRAMRTQPVYSFLFKRGKFAPNNTVGAAHQSDIPEFYGTGSSPDFIGTDALINFANTHNPNLPKNSKSLLSKFEWPLYASSATHPPLFTFQDPPQVVNITFDTFRVEAMNLINDITLRTGSTV